MIHVDRAWHSSYAVGLRSLVSTSNPIPTSHQILPNTHNVMSRESIDIVDQNKFERFNRTASMGPELVDFAHSSLPRHSVTRKQHCGRRQAGSQTTSGGRTDRILPAHPGRDIWLRNPDGDVILPRTDSHFNDTGLDFGDNPSCLVNFHLPLRVWVCQADGA